MLTLSCQFWIATCAVLFVVPAHAQLKLLPDSALSEIEGREGIGIVLENFKLETKNFNVVVNDLITNATPNLKGQSVPVTVSNLYIGREGSEKGTNLRPVTIGRLPYPISLNLVAGENLLTVVDSNVHGALGNPDKPNEFVGVLRNTTPAGVTVAEFALPPQLAYLDPAVSACIANFGGNKSCSSQPRMDLGVQLGVQVTPTRTENFAIDVREAVFDGSYFRFWQDQQRNQVVGEVKLNMFAKALDVMTCKAGDLDCNTPALQKSKTLYLADVSASIGLGYGKTQPLLFTMKSDGQFVLELPNPMGPVAIDTTSGDGLLRAKDFYANSPRINVIVSNFTMGDPKSGGYDFGRTTIKDLGFNYLKVTSHGL